MAYSQPDLSATTKYEQRWPTRIVLADIKRGMVLEDKYALLQRGLFPETLPPCFVSNDLKRALRGIIPSIHAKELHKRPTDYVRYSGTKHDGSRRYFGSPNPISYFYISEFIYKKWTRFRDRFDSSPFSVSTPRVAASSDDRPIIIPSLSELTSEASKKIGFSPFILKTDIAQFFPSIYTHSISWSAHGIEASKADPNPSSKNNIFNKLDFFVRNCQLAETRGVLVGPDAFRLIAEFIISDIDSELNDASRADIVGAARHVDDYFIGLRSETAAMAVLSTLREKLQRYSLNINDSKTKIISGLEPLNEVWAQDLRKEAHTLNGWGMSDIENTLLFINRSLELADALKTSSPIKIALRTLDQIRIYRSAYWDVVEPYLQRIIFHHGHCIDYVALLLAKRIAINEPIDKLGWEKSAIDLINRHLAFNHHHEVIWLIWLLFCCKTDFPTELVNSLLANQNAHIRSLIVAGYAEGLISKKPKLRLGGKLHSADQNWLLNLVARSTGYSKASFSGSMASEFEHLAQKKVVLIDIKSHLTNLSKRSVHAISRTRYGYDSDDDNENDRHVDLGDIDW
jgi:hypothetical protein